MTHPIWEPAPGAPHAVAAAAGHADAPSDAELFATADRVLVGTYARPDIVLSHGDGVWLWDTAGRKYLDFGSGIAVMALGHSDPEWAAAVADQAARLTHVSNLYHTRWQIELATRLVAHSFADRVFFNNTGAEATETAIKFARRYARRAAGAGDDDPSFAKTGLVAFGHGFHGRTIGAVSITAKPAYRLPFGPLLPGVAFAPYNDLAAAEALVGPDTCAVVVEPIQGEGGIRAADPAFLHGLRALCDRHGALLVFDEVQCGLGRTGALWAHEAFCVTPDIMTVAKPLAGGLPIGATLVAERVAGAIGVGEHGSTFAAGPLVARAACVVFDRIRQPAFLAHVRDTGKHLRDRIAALASPRVVDVRGSGLFVGVELDRPVKPIIDAARLQGVLFIAAGTHVIRLCPPLIVGRADVDLAVDTLGACIAAAA